MIMGADKGRSTVTVVLNKENYEEKVHKMLQDEKNLWSLENGSHPEIQTEAYLYLI